MLIRISVFVYLLLLIECSNGLFENHHEKGHNKMAVRRWRRNAVPGASTIEDMTASSKRDELQRELSENNGMKFEKPQYSIAGGRRRYVRLGNINLEEAVPVLPDIINARRHTVHTTQALSKTTTTTITTTTEITTPAPPTTSPHKSTPLPPIPSSTSISPLPLNTNNPPPNTMSETLESYFRPIDLNVPRDHLRPFQEFGKKLNRGPTPSTTINTNTLEVTTSRTKNLNSNLNNRSNFEDEQNEDMDVTFNKPFTEQNKATRPHHIMFIKHGQRKPHQPSRNQTQRDEGPVRLLDVVETLTEGNVAVTTPNIKKIMEEVTTMKNVIEAGQNNDSVNESNNVFYVKTYPPKVEKKIENVSEDRKGNAGSFLGETLPVFSREGGDQSSGEGNFNKNRTEDTLSVIQLIGVLTTPLKDASDTLVSGSPTVKIKEVTTPVSVLTTVKTALKPTNRNATSFTLLYRRRGLVYGAKKNVSTATKPKPNAIEELKENNDDKYNDVTTGSQPELRRADESVRIDLFENISKNQRPPLNRNTFGEKQAEAPSSDQQVENTITKHVRGNATYKSQLLKNARTPKTLLFSAESISQNNKQNSTRKYEQMRHSITPVTTTTTTTTLSTSPEASTWKSTPEASTVKSAPEISTWKSTSEASTLKSTPGASTWKSTRETSSLKSTSEPSTLKSAPEASTLKSTPGASRVESTSETSTLKLTPEISTLKSTPETLILKSTPETTTVKTSPKTSTVKITPHISEAENPTSKILSTAVVTSISVLGEWTPMIPVLEGANTTEYYLENATRTSDTKSRNDEILSDTRNTEDHTTPSSIVTSPKDKLIISITPSFSSTPHPITMRQYRNHLDTYVVPYNGDNTTPAYQTKESMQVSYSKNVPKQPNSNSSSLAHSNLNQTLFIDEVIRNLTSLQQANESVFVKDTRGRVEGEKSSNQSFLVEGSEVGWNGENRTGVNGDTNREEAKATPGGYGRIGDVLRGRQVVNVRDGKSTNFDGDIPEGEETKFNTKITSGHVKDLDELENKTEVPVSLPTINTVTGIPQAQNTVVIDITTSWTRRHDDTVASSTPEYVTSTEETVTSSPDIQRKNNAEGGDATTTEVASDAGTKGPTSTETTTEVNTSTAAVEQETVKTAVISSTNQTRKTTKPPRIVNIGERERTRVVYQTEEEEVSSRPGQETPDNDVATYILGTFGLIPIAIAVLLSVKYCISRRKKIWESEKSPLTFVSTNEWEFPRSKLRLQTVLGQGNFGQVYKAEADDILGERATRLVAVKTIKDGGSSQEKEDLMRELVILKQIGAHSNVVTLLGCCTEKEPYYLILEYVMYGKLLSFLRDNRTRRKYYNFSEETAELTAKDLTSFAYCVARGMEYLTSKGIIHRDLAARNILVDHNKMCKVADFGMSRSVTEPGEIYEQARPKGALPIRWMAPESLLYRVFTHKSDVWAFGILMWEIVTLGSTPYQTMCAREVIKQVRDGYRLERPDHCRPELYRVAARCWSHDPSKRPTFGEVKMELAELLEQGEPQTYVDLDSYIESISGCNTRTKQTTQVVNL